MTDAASHAFESWLVPTSAAPASPAWLSALRHAAAAEVRTQTEAVTQTEAWRYTSLKSLLEQGFIPVDETITALQADDLDDVLISDLASRRVVLVNGRYAPELSTPGAVPPGVHLDSVRDLLERDPDAVRSLLAKETTPLFTALNLAGLDDGLVLRLERAAILEQPLELIHVSIGLDQPRVAQPHHFIVLGDGAQATLLERYVSLGAAVYCTNAVVEIQLGRDAVLRHERVQMESQNAFHLSSLYLHQAANSRYHSVNLGLGARWSRTDLVTRFAGEHAECDLLGLYLAGDDQRVDYHLDVDHAVPHCTSRETFKGILYGKGRAVFDGRVVVAKNAQKSDAAMSNQNLLLSALAEVDTKPQLEINADDVKCSHGTTVGQIEPEKLFYLQSRGISASLARRMLCLGFAGEIMQMLHSEVLREFLLEQVGQRLESAAWD
jgi:Fe-S cluster assembly protein SufD